MVASRIHQMQRLKVCVCVDLDLHFVIRLHDKLIESLAYTFFLFPSDKYW
jgi:hypothetical protein